MDYRTFEPSAILVPWVKCYWTLKGHPSVEEKRQRVLPDGCVEMAFIFSDDIKSSHLNGPWRVQARAMVIGPLTASLYIEPCGAVDTFAVRFFPHGFTGFVSIPMGDLVDRETPLGELFSPQELDGLYEDLCKAGNTNQRIVLVEEFLIKMLHSPSTIDRITQGTLDLILRTKGRVSIRTLVQGQEVQVRQIERNFKRFIGVSPKKLGRIIRLQAALALLLDSQPGELIQVAYETGYFDQAHFAHDFKELAGASPKEVRSTQELLISTIFTNLSP